MFHGEGQVFCSQFIKKICSIFVHWNVRFWLLNFKVTLNFLTNPHDIFCLKACKTELMTSLCLQSITLKTKSKKLIHAVCWRAQQCKCYTFKSAEIWSDLLEAVMNYKTSFWIRKFVTIFEFFKLSYVKNYRNTDTIYASR